MRLILLSIAAASITMTACASTGGVPEPFPTPGPRPTPTATPQTGRNLRHQSSRGRLLHCRNGSRATRCTVPERWRRPSRVRLQRTRRVRLRPAWDCGAEDRRGAAQRRQGRSRRRIFSPATLCSSTPPEGDLRTSACRSVETSSCTRRAAPESCGSNGSARPTGLSASSA